MIEYHADDESLTDSEKFDRVLEHIADMEKGTYGEFFAPEGGPSDQNEVRANTIAEDYLAHRFWRLREEWASDLEEYIQRNHESYGLTWWDEAEPDEEPHKFHFTPFGTYWCDTCNSPYREKA